MFVQSKSISKKNNKYFQCTNTGYDSYTFQFNLLKGLAISIFTMLIYKKLTPILKGIK